MLVCSCVPYSLYTTGREMSSVKFSFASMLRGRLAERIIITLLERGGYRVTRLGVEEVFDEIKYLGRDEYLALGLPLALRALPDLLVTDPGVTKGHMIEVKYRRTWDREASIGLYDLLTAQREHWPASHAVLVISEADYPALNLHQDYMRVIPAGQTDLLAPATWDNIDHAGYTSDWEDQWIHWSRLPMLTHLFKFRDFDAFGSESGERGRDFWSSADYITKAIREIHKA